MNSIVRFLLGETCGILAGFGLATILLPRRAVSRTELAGLSLTLGPCVISLLMFALGAFLRDGSLLTAIATVAMFLGILGASRRRGLTFPPQSNRSFWILLVPMLGLIAWQAGIHPLTSDGLFNFELHGKLAAAAGGKIPAAFFSDPSRTWAHPRYPLFLPLNEAWLYLCVGRPDQGLIALLSLHFAMAAMCLLYTGIATLTSDPRRGFVAVALLFLLPAAILAPGGVASLWADFPLALLFLAAIIYLLKFALDECALGLPAVLIGMLPWVKREGIVLAGLLVLATAWSTYRRGLLRQLPPALLPLILVTIPWGIFLQSVHASSDRDFLPVTLATTAEHLDRLPLVFAMLGRELLAVERWTLLWPLALLATVRVIRTPALARWRMLPPIIAAGLALYAGVYIFSAWATLVLHVSTSLPRLLLPLAMPALLLIAAAFPQWEVSILRARPSESAEKLPKPGYPQD